MLARPVHPIHRGRTVPAVGAAAFAAALTWLGGSVHVVVNNAGIGDEEVQACTFQPTPRRAHALSTPGPQRWELMLDLNLRAVIHGTLLVGRRRRC